MRLDVGKNAVIMLYFCSGFDGIMMEYIVVSDEQWADFAATAAAYGSEFTYSEEVDGFHVYGDIEQAQAILWAIGCMNGCNENADGIQSENDWPDMHNGEITLLCN